MFGFFAEAQISSGSPTNFNYGIKLSNRVGQTTPDSIPVMDGQGIIKGYITKPQLSTQLTPSFSNVTGKPTTLAGYGITDAVPQTRTISGSNGILALGDLSVNRTLTLDFDYLDTRYAGGFKQHEAVRVTTTANITLSGTQTIDGVAVVAGNRVLVKNQTTGSENGVYVVAAGAWARSADFDQVIAGEVEQGASFFVEEGTTLGKTGWSLSNAGTITLGTTALTFIQYAGANNYLAGAGLDLVGNAFSHEDTSTFAPTALTGANVISNLTFDTFGHTTNWTTRSLTTGDIGAQPIDGDLTAIAGLAGTSGLLRKIAADTWSLDTNSYLTTAGTAANSQLFDNLDSPDFVRSTGNINETISGTKTFTASTVVLNNAGNHGFVTGGNGQRLLIGGGSTWSGTAGAYLSLEGLDYGGAGLGGNLQVNLPSGKFFQVNQNIRVSGISNLIGTVEFGTDTSINGDVLFRKSDGGDMSTQWEDNYYRYRRGGTGAVSGWRWDNFDTEVMSLSVAGVLTAKNVIISDVPGGTSILRASNGATAFSQLQHANASGGALTMASEQGQANTVIRSYGNSELNGGDLTVEGNGFFRSNVLSINTTKNNSNSQLINNLVNDGTNNQHFYSSRILTSFSSAGWWKIQRKEDGTNWTDKLVLDTGANLTAIGTLKGTRLISTVATGTAPMTVTSTTLVPNLNADLFDGLNNADFVRATGAVNQNIDGIKTFTSTTVSTNKDTGAIVIEGGLGVEGAINAGGDITAFSTSDMRLKDNMKPIAGAMARLKHLNGYDFDWNEVRQPLYKGHDIGLMAQEVQKVIPSAVRQSTTGYLQVDYKKVTPLLVQALKEKDSEIQELKKELKQLKGFVGELKILYMELKEKVNEKN